MKKFLLNSAPDRCGKIRLSGDDYHYLVRVRRLAPGEYFPGRLASGENVLIRVDSVDGGILAGTVTPEPVEGGFASREKQGAPDTEMPVPGPRIILFQALPKGVKMDLIVRQAAEGGIAEIVPFASEFSVPKPAQRGKSSGQTTGAAAGTKTARWRRIIKEARQQSGSPEATSVTEPVSIQELFTVWEELKAKGAVGILFHQVEVTAQSCSGNSHTEKDHPEKIPLEKILLAKSPLEKRSLHGYLDNRPSTVVIAIGPEGGFSPTEVTRFLDAGFMPLTIGSTVLRTETAAVYAAAAVTIILQEKDSWTLHTK
ncbi:MAG: 16S rRNA (uracil(1498)-N(3))-methyltransferase [Treponema sp.]|nr:16S rRNA (uracil(1498)-N(3))-methyltransferase [Treponema sp.]